jgi:hypothetical protein
MFKYQWISGQMTFMYKHTIIWLLCVPVWYSRDLMIVPMSTIKQ